MVIDVARCTGCYCCFAACKDEYWNNDYFPYTVAQPRHGQFWMNIAKNERGKFPYVKVAYMPLPCMHCEDAPCMGAANDDAVSRTADGIVVIDPHKAAGQRQLLDDKACPYGVIFWNEEKQLPQKCSFCAHRVANGKIPRCVQACPSECIKFGDLDDPNSEVAQFLETTGATPFHPEWKTTPSVYYANLHLMIGHFIAGSVVLGDTGECAAGERVTLNGPAVEPAITKTNAFGNFEFDGLEPGTYAVEIEAPGYSKSTLEVELSKSKYLGDIMLWNVP
jgi:Fe-S-cluster-containing dehydrogenase component